MNINLSRAARANIDNLHAYIAQNKSSAADKTVARLFQSMAHLETFPLMGRKGRVENTRQLVVPGLPYLIIYTIPSATDLTVLRVTHISRQWPPAGG